MLKYLFILLQGEFPPRSFHIGDEIKAKVLGFRDLKTRKYVFFWKEGFKLILEKRQTKESALANNIAKVLSSRSKSGYPIKSILRFVLICVTFVSSTGESLLTGS